MMPSCDQIGVPIHFHSSTTSGSASLMSLRILLRVSPRQSPSSAILFEMSSDADWPWLAPDFFMFSSWKFQIYFICKTVEDSHVRLQSNVTAGVYATRPSPGSPYGNAACSWSSCSRLSTTRYLIPRDPDRPHPRHHQRGRGAAASVESPMLRRVPMVLWEPTAEYEEYHSGRVFPARVGSDDARGQFGQRLDVAVLFVLVLNLPQVNRLLHIEPALRCRAEQSREPDRHFGRERPLAVQKLRHSETRHAKPLS